MKFSSRTKCPLKCDYLVSPIFGAGAPALSIEQIHWDFICCWNIMIFCMIKEFGLSCYDFLRVILFGLFCNLLGKWLGSYFHFHGFRDGDFLRWLLLWLSLNGGVAVYFLVHIEVVEICIFILFGQRSVNRLFIASQNVFISLLKLVKGEKLI